jgi:hypothetical protein
MVGFQLGAETHAGMLTQIEGVILALDNQHGIYRARHCAIYGEPRHIPDVM